MAEISRFTAHFSPAFLPARSQFAAFRAASDGELQGVGLVISSDSGKVVVLAPVKGGPAERAGIKPGDEVGFQLSCALGGGLPWGIGLAKQAVK